MEGITFPSESTFTLFPRSLLLGPADIQVMIAVLSFSPRGKVIPLLTLHLIPSLFLFRSSVIHHNATPIGITALVIELAYFFALICIPYQDSLDRLLGGAHSKGGGKSGSDVPLPKHCEEPVCTSDCWQYTGSKLICSRLISSNLCIHHSLPRQALL
jgi:hypothetical protein